MDCVLLSSKSYPIHNQLRFKSIMTTSAKQQQSRVPVVGTVVHFQPEDISLSNDGVNYVCRIAYDSKADRWTIASRWNPEVKKWMPVARGRRVGMFVFLNDKPTATDSVIRITSIQPTGRGAFGDPEPGVAPSPVANKPSLSA